MTLTPDQARDAVASLCAPRAAEAVEVTSALGLVAAAEVTSPVALPPFANSAMDGFAVRAGDTDGGGVRLRLVGESRAGAPAEGEVTAGTAMRVSTGAAMPAGADAVVRLEDADDHGDAVTVGAVAPGRDVRPAGDDVARGDVMVPAGRRLGPGEVAALQAVGLTRVAAHPRPRVAVVATGDETVPAGMPLGPGDVHDSNRPMLAAQVWHAGGDVVLQASGVPDTLDATATALDEALGVADLVVVAGGVSVGRHDHVKRALALAGVAEVFWRVALRPGHPTWCGRGVVDGRDVVVLGLPGNPVSAFVTFALFARPAIRALAGDRAPDVLVPATYRGPAQAKAAGVVSALRVALSPGDPLPVASPTWGNQRSHSLRSLVGADGLALVDAGREALADGDTVRVLPLG